ncbi:MAG TPA: hypothetical protein VMS00_05200, partial [Acidimicrobiales bacterium]|nr:hypothetical protein [Acidimicrobiales bacterium]
SAIGFAVLAAACGASNSPGVAGSGSIAGGHKPASTGPSRGMAQALAYARCMRSHGVPDFPDPTPFPGGGIAFQINAGSGSDLNHNSPKFKRADQACHSQLPGGEQPSPLSSDKIAAEVKWALCMRSHGLPGFPDPDAQGSFDSSRFNGRSPVFQSASKSCKSLQPTGSITAVPGSGP